MSNRIFNMDSGWMVALLVPIIAILPILNADHIIQTADGPFHIHRILAVTTLIQHGDLYPRWIPWFHLGYGYPILNFYAPLATYVGGVMGLFGISAPNAFTFLIVLAWMIGSLGMYVLGRHVLNAYAGILAALIWCYAPSTLQAVWNQGSISQIVATAFVPWFFYTLVGVVEDPNPRRSAAFALALSLVILAHQPTTVLVGLFAAPAIALLCVWHGWRHGKLKRRLVYVLFGVLLAAGVSMIFLLPLAVELAYVQVSSPAADIPQTLAHYFLRADDLFLQPQAPDLSDLNRNLAETVGLVDGMLAAVGLLGLLRRKQYGLALLCAAACAFILFLVQADSMPFWLHVPLMAQLRFPGRTLHIGRLFFSLLGGASLLLLPKRWWQVGTMIVAVFVIGAALPTVYPSRPFVDYAHLTPADEVRYEIATHSFGGTSYDEFKPVWGERTPTPLPNLDDIQLHPFQIHVIDPEETGTSVTQIDDNSVQIVTDHALNLSFRQFYFPGWSAIVDGAVVKPFPEERFGLLTVSVAPGSHTITVQRENLPAEQIAPLLTLISVGVMIWMWRKGQDKGSERREALQPQFAGFLGGGICALALLNGLVIQPHTDWFRQESPLDSPAYMQTPVHQRFGDAYELLGYTLHQTEIQPGGTLDVTLYWRALRPLDQIYQPIVQVVNPSVSQAWAVSEKFFIGDYQLNHAPDTFVSDEHRLLVQADAPPYLGRLLVKLIDTKTGQALALPDGSSQLLLDGYVRIRWNDLPVEKRMNAVVDGKVELWCASVQQQGDQLEVELYWHVLAPLPASDVSVFMHGFDAKDQVVALFDGPMLNGDYAAVNWLRGQYLVDSISASVSPGLERLSVGLHVSSGDRLPVLADGLPAPENRIWIPLDSRSCTQAG